MQGASGGQGSALHPAGVLPLHPAKGIVQARLPSGELPKAKCQAMLEFQPSRHPFRDRGWVFYLG